MKKKVDLNIKSIFYKGEFLVINAEFINNDNIIAFNFKDIYIKIIGKNGDDVVTTIINGENLNKLLLKANEKKDWIFEVENPNYTDISKYKWETNLQFLFKENTSETEEIENENSQTITNIEKEGESLMEEGKSTIKSKFEYDVAFSFAGEDRKYVEKVAEQLKDKINIFYDKFEEIDLWGKNLYTHLNEIYSKKSKYVVMFISEHYSKKLWTNHERQSAQERAFNENKEYILPARFDNTEIPGVLKTVGYIDLKKIDEIEFSNIILKKIKKYKEEEVPEKNSKKNEKNISLNQKIYKSDIELYNKIKEIIKNSVEFSKDWDFGSPHRDNSLNGLFHIELQFESPDFEFINEKLEIIKKELFESIKKFILSVSINTFPKGNGFQEIPYEWSYEQPELFEKTRNEINSLADEMWKKYCNFVKMGRICLEL
ncbi:toll/interleukin-1 receptor domain-containing protein [Haliovirga abyssi]|uniref:TIR domain-containing protein n=1 Tax=Haliovirga abyssi TaxID=2996794 RepID=A0AAU9DRC6_9FUSO|nr:TIR domain-containing protein [Haliovirga abyssi]BDU49479.1 hypothetical protein HLVA_00480 [Haliovirga abyssi]